MRMCPSQNLESILMVYLIRSLGWTRVGLIYTTDTAGSSGAAAFEAVGAELGVQTVARASFALNAPAADVYYALEGMKATGTTILAFIGAITDMQAVIQMLVLGNVKTGAPPLGMWGRGSGENQQRRTASWLTTAAGAATRQWRSLLLSVSCCHVCVPVYVSAINGSVFIAT